MLPYICLRWLMEKISNKVDTNSAWLWSLKPKYFFVSISGICLHLYIIQSIHSIILGQKIFKNVARAKKNSWNEMNQFHQSFDSIFFTFSESTISWKCLKKNPWNLLMEISRIFGQNIYFFMWNQLFVYFFYISFSAAHSPSRIDVDFVESLEIHLLKIIISFFASIKCP